MNEPYMTLQPQNVPSTTAMVCIAVFLIVWVAVGLVEWPVERRRKRP